MQPYKSFGRTVSLPEKNQIYMIIFAICMIFSFSITAYGQDMDFGDAPDPDYPTLLSSNGARHTVIPGIYLGSIVDVETDGLPEENALGDDGDGDDDEDGVDFTSALVRDSTASVTVTASVAGYLNAWVDFNNDGDVDGTDLAVFAGDFGRTDCP